MPDNVTAAAVAMAINQGGGASCKTTVLITPEEMDKAGKVRVKYKSPAH